MELDAEIHNEIADMFGEEPDSIELEWCESGYCKEHEEEYDAYMVLSECSSESRGMAYVGKKTHEVW